LTAEPAISTGIVECEMDRARRFTLLGLAVVAALAPGCGEKKPPTLRGWASSVCVAYDGYATPEVRSGLKKLSSLYWTAYGVSGPGEIDFKNPPELRADAPTLISQDLLLAEIANVAAAHRSVIGKLEALERPPDTEAGRLAGRILDDEIKRIREHLDYLHAETEKEVREAYFREPTPREALTMMSLGGSSETHKPAC